MARVNSALSHEKYIKNEMKNQGQKMAAFAMEVSIATVARERGKEAS